MSEHLSGLNNINYVNAIQTNLLSNLRTGHILFDTCMAMLLATLCTTIFNLGNISSRIKRFVRNDLASFKE